MASKDLSNMSKEEALARLEELEKENQKLKANAEKKGVASVTETTTIHTIQYVDLVRKVAEETGITAQKVDQVMKIYASTLADSIAETLDNPGAMKIEYVANDFGIQVIRNSSRPGDKVKFKMGLNSVFGAQATKGAARVIASSDPEDPRNNVLLGARTMMQEMGISGLPEDLQQIIRNTGLNFPEEGRMQRERVERNNEDVEQLEVEDEAIGIGEEMRAEYRD